MSETNRNQILGMSRAASEARALDVVVRRSLLVMTLLLLSKGWKSFRNKVVTSRKGLNCSPGQKKLKLNIATVFERGSQRRRQRSYIAQEELELEEEELEQVRQLDRLRRAVERASATGSAAGGSQVCVASSVPSVHREASGVRVGEWVRKQNDFIDQRDVDSSYVARQPEGVTLVARTFTICTTCASN